MFFISSGLKILPSGDYYLKKLLSGAEQLNPSADSDKETDKVTKVFIEQRREDGVQTRTRLGREGAESKEAVEWGSGQGNRTHKTRDWRQGPEAEWTEL
jgi:hypothetical protein